MIGIHTGWPNSKLSGIGTEMLSETRGIGLLDLEVDSGIIKHISESEIETLILAKSSGDILRYISNILRYISRRRTRAGLKRLTMHGVAFLGREEIGMLADLVRQKELSIVKVVDE